MIHKQSNKTALQSQNMIADALFRLMKRKPFPKITVTEVCEEAGIGRKTFYRNFDLREDVIDFRLERLCAQYEQEIRGMTSGEQLYHHFVFLKDHAEDFISLYLNDLMNFVNQHFSVLQPQTMPIWSEDPVEQEYRSAYVIAGMEAIQRVWIERGFTERIEEVVELARRCQQQMPLPLQTNL